MTLGHRVESGFGEGQWVCTCSTGACSPREVPGLGHSYAPPSLTTCPQGRPGEICIMGPKGQKVSCGFCGAESGCQAEAAALSRPRHV